ncbi:hypothetical protein D3C76_535400 [compost metagenome]
MTLSQRTAPPSLPSLSNATPSTQNSSASNHRIEERDHCVQGRNSGNDNSAGRNSERLAMVV